RGSSTSPSGTRCSGPRPAAWAPSLSTRSSRPPRRCPSRRRSPSPTLRRSRSPAPPPTTSPIRSSSQPARRCWSSARAGEGATFVPSGEGVAERVRKIAPEGVDLLVDLVGGQALRELAPLAKEPSRIVSAADADTATELGGAGRERTEGALEKITGVVQYGLVDPHVSMTFPLERAAEAIAAVETGHGAGKTVIVP